MPSKFRVAAQMFGFREFTKTAADAAKAMKRVKKIGYDYAQISGFGPIPAADIRALCLDAGVTPIGAHIGLPKFREDWKKVVADCKDLGISYVAIPWLDAKQQKSLADWKKLFREFEGYAKRFAAEGITVQYHNHDFEFRQYGVKRGAGGKALLDMLYEGTTALQAELDLGWVARGGCNPVNWVRKVAGRMDQVHFKDWCPMEPTEKDPNRNWGFRAIGQGSLDWPEILKACKKAGVRDFIVEQDSCPVTGDPFLEYGISRKYLATLGL